VVITIPENTWNFLEFFTRQSQNEKEKLELLQTILSHEKNERGEILIAVEKDKIKENSVLYKLLDSLLPNWRTFVHDAVGYLEEKKTFNI